VLVQEANDWLYVEPKEYLEALGWTLAGGEKARVVLARARQRLEGNRPDARPEG
jgi:hypothetical protein